jgi:hypothetical protein
MPRPQSQRSRDTRSGLLCIPLLSTLLLFLPCYLLADPLCGCLRPLLTFKGGFSIYSYTPVPTPSWPIFYRKCIIWVDLSATSVPVSIAEETPGLQSGLKTILVGRPRYRDFMLVAPICPREA